MSDPLVMSQPRVSPSVSRETDLEHPRATAAPHLVHVPTPGDHYSAATGSAVMTVIYEMSRCHAAAGGRSGIMVGRQTRHDYPVGDHLEFDARSLPDRRQKLIDAAAGRIGLPRPFARRLYRPALQTLEADFDGVILLHNAPAAVGLFARRFSRAKICLWPHNDLFGTYGRREVRRTIEASHLVICVSQFIADGIARQMGSGSSSLRRKLCVVNNGVDTVRFRPRSGAAPSGEPVVIFVGRVTPQKGPDLLIRAAAKLLSPRRKFKVRIVGNSGFSAADPLTPYEQELRKLAAPLGAAVEFQSFVDRAGVTRELDSASIYCVPSNWDDPCPLTVPEGLASGLPCIVSRRGGIPEEAGDAALYFTPPNIDSLAEKLALLLDDPTAASQWGQRARARGLEITWENQYRVLRRHLAGEGTDV
jgi:glycosyltransferase involved in cell wall biosynthesis